ncbi:MAG: GNAT family N-acetyltransferase, partial [Gammaproteobacteria bacterium]
MSLQLRFLSSAFDIKPAQWDAICATDYPFLRHRFIAGLEQSRCTSAATGWQPWHAALYESEHLLALMPMYIKAHSYGEYVFDWSWEQAWQTHGLAYYPKLVTAVPFTPATGPRLCVDKHLAAPEHARELLINSVQDWAVQQGLSSWHGLFTSRAIAEELATQNCLTRTGTQFHWFNEGYDSFDDFLSRFNARKRKAVKRERRRVQEQNIRCTTLRGAEIAEEHWQTFYRFYRNTYLKRSGHGGYLSEAFFCEICPQMGEQVVMVLASEQDKAIAGALYFVGGDTLYGRYWGCETERDCLHFEVCYYQGIDFCIANHIARFDPGAQGEHKIQRGFTPVTTYSSHFIADTTLRNA